MSRTKKLVEDLNEKEEVRNEKTLEPTTESRVFVKPELYNKMIEVIVNSIPRAHTISEVNSLLDALSKSSAQGNVNYGPAN